MTLNTSLYKDVDYDPLKDFVPVAAVAAVPNVVAVPSNSPYRTLAELIEDARRNPGKLSYASTGTGASPWLGTEYLKSLAKVDILEVPYKGAGSALIDTMAGRTAFVFDAVTTSTPQLQAGNIRALGVSSAKRVAALPDVPTIAEQGYPGFDVVAWFGLWAPAGTPEDVVRRVNTEVQTILKSPDIRARFNGMGAEIMSGTVEEFTKFHREEYERWTEFVRKAKVKQQ
jgi:tripartite-type tricarboxylate transporter receptor subunit TctC